MIRAFLATEVTARCSIVDSIAALAILSSETTTNQVHVIGSMRW
jgi:hypothetical protein